jgi:hypothetical protein
MENLSNNLSSFHPDRSHCLKEGETLVLPIIRLESPEKVSTSIDKKTNQLDLPAVKTAQAERIADIVAELSEAEGRPKGATAADSYAHNSDQTGQPAISSRLPKQTNLPVKNPALLDEILTEYPDLENTMTRTKLLILKNMSSNYADHNPKFDSESTRAAA